MPVIYRGIITRARNFDWSNNTTLSVFEGVEEAALLGPGNEAESIPESQLSWPHGFVMRALKMAPGSVIPDHSRQEEEVIFVQKGTLEITVDGKTLEMEEGDTFTTPIGSKRTFSNSGTGNCIVYITRRGDQPEAADFS